MNLLSSIDVHNELLGYGLELLQPYVNASTRLVYCCSCGSVGKSNLHDIRKGVRCGHCPEMAWREYFRSYGCEIVYYASAAKVTYQCTCGAITTTKASGFKSRNKTCPKCRVVWNYNPLKVKKRGSLLNWKRAVVIRDEFECQACFIDEGLEVHHIEAYYIRPELADDVFNGITLCTTCHKRLHALYGYNVGKANLLNYIELGL